MGIDYTKLSDDALNQISSGKPLDYSKLSDDDLTHIAAQGSPLPTPASSSTDEGASSLDAAILGAQKGITLNFAPKILEATGLGNEKEQLAKYAAAQKAHPYIFGGSEFAGSIPAASAVAGIGALGGLGAIGQGALIGGTAATGASDLTNPEQALKQIGQGAAIGGAIGKIGEMIGPTVSAGLRKTAQKLGISPETIEKYLANPEEINAAPETEDIVNNLTTKSADAQQNAQEAQVNLLTATQDAKMNAQQVANESQQAVSEAKLGEPGTSPEEAAVEHPQQLANEAVNATKDLKTLGLESESQATNRLEEIGLTIDPEQQINKIDSLIQDYMIGPKKGLETSKNSIADLKDLREKWVNLQNQGIEHAQEIAGHNLSSYEPIPNPVNPADTLIPARDARTLLKDINRTMNYPTSEGAFYDSPGAERYRSYFQNEILKPSDPIQLDTNGDITNPESYQALIEKAAGQFSLLSKANSEFGNIDRAFNSLRNIHTPNKILDRQILEQLGNETGKDFTTPIANYIDNIKEAQAQAQYLTAASKQPAYIQSQIDPTLQQSAEQTAVAAAPYKGISPGTAQNFVKSVQKGTNINDQNRMGAIQQALKPEDSTLPQDIVNRGILNEFTPKDNARGSARTLLGALGGNALGTALGPVGTSVGGLVGGMAGRVVDTGRPLAKVLLDIGVKVDDPNSLAAYAPILLKAAARGGSALAATHYMLFQSDPGYQKLTSSQK